MHLHETFHDLEAVCLFAAAKRAAVFGELKKPEATMRKECASFR